ncbi:MAG TPA: hypothetical protein VI215_04910 [Bacteroidota bacterium]
MLLVVGAMAILSTLTLSINTTILRTYMISYDSEATIDAISIGQAMIDEINTQAFDSLTNATSTVTDPSFCTPKSRLGADIDSEKTFASLVAAAPDTAPFKSTLKFNDVDDYQGYRRVVKSSHLGTFSVRDSVFYVQEGNHDTPSSTQTWFKKVEVTVTHSNLLSPVKVKGLIVFRRYLP